MKTDNMQGLRVDHHDLSQNVLFTYQFVVALIESKCERESGFSSEVSCMPQMQIYLIFILCDTVWASMVCEMSAVWPKPQMQLSMVFRMQQRLFGFKERQIFNCWKAFTCAYMASTGFDRNAIASMMSASWSAA